MSCDCLTHGCSWPTISGTNCESGVSACVPNPCAHGSTCLDVTNGYYCACASGYTGETCQTEVDDCSANPCQNNGTCVDGLNSFACQCPVGFRGECREIIRTVKKHFYSLNTPLVLPSIQISQLSVCCGIFDGQMVVVVVPEDLNSLKLFSNLTVHFPGTSSYIIKVNDNV